MRPYIAGDISTEAFFAALRDFLFQEYALQPYRLSQGQLAEIRALQAERYDQWSWNYGASPAYRLRKARQVDGCGKLEIFLDVKKGILRDVAFYGDYFGNGDTRSLARRLSGCPMEAAALRTALKDLEIGTYFNHMDLETFLEILLQ